MEKQSKYLFAAYLNMARHNAFITLSYISTSIGGTEGSEDNLSDMLPVRVLTDRKAEPEKIKRTMELLDKHFPFLKPMLNKELRPDEKSDKKEVGTMASPENYQTVLKTAFKELNSQRNQYTHFKHERKDFDRNLIEYMKNCFDGAKRVAKERFKLEDRDIEHLNRFRKKKENVDNKKSKYEEDPRFHYKFDDENGKLTDKGLAFFICLFLERKYAMLFLPQIHGFKQSGQKGIDEGKRATKKLFSIYSVQIPKLRIDSESSKMTLGIDMLNELKKCPDELFDLLSKEHQDRFRVSTDDKPKEKDGGEDEDLVLQKRYGNRFPYLALSYIDQQELFQNVRFQVSLGTYRYEFYGKQGVDNIERVRILQKKLHGFGRLDEIEKKRKEGWKALIRPFEKIEKDTADQLPYITDSYARYMISNNRVGMYWDIKDSNEAGDYLPKLTEEGAINKAPTCWLSIYELPALIFHSLLNKNGDKNCTQNIIREYARKYIKFFKDIQDGELKPSTKENIAKDIKEGYNIEFTQVPKELQDYLTGKKVNIDDRFEKLAEERIRQMLERGNRRIERIKRDITTIQDIKLNRVGKKRFVEIKSGVLADFLAEDLLLFQPTKDEGKDKLTGMNFQVLQATIAYYGRYKAEMKQIFKNCNLLDSAIAHPFLAKVMNKTHNDIVDFYTTYLIERGNYLSNCLKKQNYKNYHFLYPEREKWQQRNNDYYKKLAGKHLKLPIELPRGLFNDAIKKFLENNVSMQQALEKGRCNTVYLIQNYFEAVRKDSWQQFYDFKRCYKCFDLLHGIKKGNKLQSVYFSTAEFIAKLKTFDSDVDKYTNSQYNKEKERLRNAGKYRELKTFEEEKEVTIEKTKNKLTRLQKDFEKNEKLLRLSKVQDMLLFWMAKNILVDKVLELDEIEKYKLKDIMPDSEKDILSKQTSFSITLNLKDGIKKTIRQKQIKLKNFGNFFRFVRDRRIASLLPHIAADEIDRDTLEKELENYDDHRKEIFRFIHQFEEKVIKDKSLQETSPNFIKILEHCPEMKGINKKQMRLMRNAFCHNTYPSVKDLRQKEEKADEEMIQAESLLYEGASIPDIANRMKEIFEGLITN